MRCVLKYVVRSIDSPCCIGQHRQHWLTVDTAHSRHVAIVLQRCSTRSGAGVCVLLHGLQRLKENFQKPGAPAAQFYGQLAQINSSLSVRKGLSFEIGTDNLPAMFHERTFARLWVKALLN